MRIPEGLLMCICRILNCAAHKSAQARPQYFIKVLVIFTHCVYSKSSSFVDLISDDDDWELDHSVQNILYTGDTPCSEDQMR